MKPRIPTIVWLVRLVSLSALLIGIVAGALWWRYGSLRTASSVLAGRPVFLTPRRVDLGPIEPGAPVPFEVALRNETGEAVSVLGIDDCCYCRLVTETPLTVPAQGIQQLQLIYTAPATAVGEPLRASVPLITSSNANQPLIELVGVFVEPEIPHLAPPRVEETVDYER